MSISTYRHNPCLGLLYMSGEERSSRYQKGKGRYFISSSLIGNISGYPSPPYFSILFLSMTPSDLKNMKEDILSLLEEFPSLNKGDIISYFSLPISSSQGSLSRTLSYIIWGYNQREGREGGYSLYPSLF